LGQFLDEILKIIITRIQHAEMPSLIESLILIFARLINNHPNYVINFLINLQLENVPAKQIPNINNGTINALTYILFMWTKWHIEFRGSYNLKLSLISLSKFLLFNDEKINSIMVPGELIISKTSGIITRSKSKKTSDKWTMIPLKVKILQLILKEYQILIEEESIQKNNKNNEEEILNDEEYDEENEWEDIIEEENKKIYQELDIDESSFVDAGIFFGDDEDWSEIDNEFEDFNLKDDPIYHIHLKEYIINFLINFSKNDPNTLLYLNQQLSFQEQQCLKNIIN
jgi:hypothetical protein